MGERSRNDEVGLGEGALGRINMKSKFENSNQCIMFDGLVHEQVNADKFVTYFASCYAASNRKHAAELELRYATMRQKSTGFWYQVIR